MANFFVRSYADIVAAINTANTNNVPVTGVQVNDSLYFQQDITLTAEQVLNLTTPENTGTLRFRGGTPAGFDENGTAVTGRPAMPMNYTLTVLNELNINDSQPTTAQPSFTIGPFTLQIGNGTAAGGLSGNLRADDGGVLVFNRSVDTTYTGTFSVEEEDNAIRNDVAGTTVTFDASATTATAAPGGGGNLAIRPSQGTGAASGYELELGGDGDGVISGIIGDSGIPNVGAAETQGNIEKDGDGTWTLSGANTYVGTTTVEEGTLVVANNTGLGTVANGTTVLSGGTLALSGGITVGAEALSLAGDGVEEGGEDAAGALQNLSGNNSFAGAITLAAASSIVSEAGTLTLSGGIGGAFGLTLGGDGDGVVSGAIGSTVTGLTKEGDGTWTLSGTNAYTGATTVSGGTLLVDGSIAGSATSVGDEGTIGGTGTLGAVGVSDGGTFAAGDVGTGRLTTASLALASGATFEEQIGGTAAGSFDAAIVNGILALGGASLDLSLVGDFAPTVGQSFTIIENDGADAVIGTFSDADGDALAEGDVIVTEEGRSFQISYAGGTGSNDVVLTAVNTPPTLTDDAAFVLQRGVVAGNVLTNDTDTDGGTPIVTGIGTGDEPTPVAGATTIDGFFGSLTIQADGAFSYDADVEGLIAVGASATDTFTYTASDGQGGTSTAELDVTVFGSGVGDAGDNTFLMTGPGKSARGLAGDDTYIVNSISDRVGESRGGGDDTVLSSVSYTLGAGQEIETLRLLASTGSRTFNLTGNDFDQDIVGNAGANKITGGGGADTLRGLGGADTFVFNALGDSTLAAAGRDTIEDFRQSQNDRIDLHLIDANTRAGGNQAFTFIDDAAFSRTAGELQARSTTSGDTLVSGDVNGDGSADFAVLVNGRIALERGDFVL